MAGEMAWIKRSGLDSNGDEWGTHAAVARAIGGKLRPFDVYQGPYINAGMATLWICPIDESRAVIYREDFNACSMPFYMHGGLSSTRNACRAARALMSIQA